MPKGVGYSKAAMSKLWSPGTNPGGIFDEMSKQSAPRKVNVDNVPGMEFIPPSPLGEVFGIPRSGPVRPGVPKSKPVRPPPPPPVTPPPITMPNPSGPSPLPPPPPSFGSSGSITGASSIGGAIFNVAAGGFTGGMTSYTTGGSFTQGAIAGAAVGAGFGAAAKYQLPSRANAFVAKQLGQKGVTGYSKDIAGFTAGFENAAVRRGAFGAGAALGGFVFGGDRSHKRGFNGRRGNSIGR